MPTDRQRREAERRRLKRQLQRRAQRDARRRRNSLIVSITGVLVVAAIVASVVVATTKDSSTSAAGNTSTPAPTTTTSAPPTAPYPCSWTPSGTAARAVTAPTTTTPPKSGTVNLLVSTSQGSMTFQLDRALAPCAVASFESLAQQHFYDDTSCHRLTTSGFYVLQCGDPLGTGLGGPGYTIPDEATGNETYPAGTLAMARQASVPHSGGSQFFIVYKDSPALQNGLGSQQYTVFGKVTSGLNVVDKVAAKGAEPRGDGKPKLPLTLNSMAVVE